MHCLSNIARKSTSRWFLPLTLLILSYHLAAQDSILYKTTKQRDLYLKVYRSEKADTIQPAVIFFFGGGWNKRNLDQFEPHAKYFSKRGLTCFIADYRVFLEEKTSPFDALKDAKSAIRFLRTHSKNLNIDPEKIVATGGSAGGHLAASTALIDGYNDEQDDILVSCKPSALVLFNPVYDNGPGGHGYDRVSEAYPTFSPLHNIRAGAPPTLVFLGTEDKYVPVVTAQYFDMAMKKVGSRSELEIYEGEKHGFFNYKYFNSYKDTIQKMDRFLISLGFLAEKPAIEIK
jgi:acetyl esterase/lipase